MHAMLQKILDHLRGIWHRRWIGLGAAWIAAIIAVAIVYRIPEKYEASTRVYVDTESLLKPLLAGLAIQPNLDQQVSLMSRTLISRPNVEKLVRMADLDLQITRARDRDAQIDDVMSSIRLTGGAATNLYVISYRNPSPERARKVVQSLLAIFVESSLGDKRQDSRTAVKFVDDQIKRYVETLQASENRLKEFKLKYLGVSQRDGQDYFARLSKLSGDIDAATLDLQSAEQSRDSYKRELAGETSMSLLDDEEIRAKETLPEVDNRISALKKELDDLLRKYTDQHPDVVATKRLIEQLQQQRTTELEARRKASAGAPVSKTERNPVFQQLKISLADAEASVAGARAKLSGYQSQYQQLKAQARLVPEVEAEYVQLTRDYDVQKKTYESLLARREAAGMGMDVQDTGGAQFRVIDPPRVTPEPVAPTRLMLLGLAFAVSLLVGIVASVVVSEVMPIFHDARALRQVCKRPILGMVSILQTPALMRIRRRGAYLFAGGVGALFAAFIAVVALSHLIGRIA